MSSRVLCDGHCKWVSGGNPAGSALLRAKLPRVLAKLDCFSAVCLPSLLGSLHPLMDSTDAPRTASGKPWRRSAASALHDIQSCFNQPILQTIELSIFQFSTGGPACVHRSGKTVPWRHSASGVPDIENIPFLTYAIQQKPILIVNA